MSQPLPRSPASTPLIAQAIALHNSGRLAEAEALVRHVLTFEPAHPDAINLLGSIALRGGHPDAAVVILTRAVEVAPRAIEPRVNLGHALKALSRHAEAIEAYRGAVRLRPRDARTRYALGNGLLADGQFAAAEAELREATRLLPRFAEAHNHLGHVLRQLGRPKDAESAFRRALSLAPGQAEWHLNLALALGEQKRGPDAIAALKDAVRLAPDHIDALHAYGTMLVRARRYEEALGPLEHLRTLLPGMPDPFAGLVQTLTHLGRFDEAVALGRETVEQWPDSAGGRSNLGTALLALGQLREAEAEFDAAVRLEPGHAVARFGRALTVLTAGRLEEAWDDYEACIEANRMVSDLPPAVGVDVDRLPGEPWRGGPRDGRSLLICQQQGLGDTIQMASYVALLAQGGPVSFLVQAPLRRLLAAAPGVASVVTLDETPPPADFHCHDMSLPRLLRTSLATIPGGVPWLRAEPEQADQWRARLAHAAGRKIGLAWRGNAGYPFDRLRSISQEHLEILHGARDAAFVSLQLPRPERPPPLPLLDMTDELTDFADTAALIEALDLVITVDTSIAHLAGALGRPIWLLNRFNTDWRWMLDRDDSPWYPTMRIFRQAIPNDWAGVLTAVRMALDS
jgi:tetratricopeptide (TPR) repeat protein